MPTQCPRPVLAHPADCACTDRKGPIAGHTLRHQCQPTELCGASAVHPVSGSIPLPLCSAYLSVVHVSMHDFRDVTRTGPTRQGSIAALRQQVHRVAVLWAALASLNASLPLHVLVSGDNASESVNAIQRQQLEGVVLHRMPYPNIPAWASTYHRASFAKLSAFNASLLFDCRFIYLDTDMLPLRNLDHLAHLRHTPALVFRSDPELLNSGVMVIDVRTQDELDRFWHGMGRHLATRRRPKPLQRGEECSRTGAQFQGQPWGSEDGGDQEALTHKTRDCGRRALPRATRVLQRVSLVDEPVAALVPERARGA